MPNETIQTIIERALDAYAALAELGEEIEDEWSYVIDLVEAWRARLTEVADARGTEPALPQMTVAIDRTIDEVSRITDPHRAIDWLSTFPLVVLLAVGERP